MFERLNIEDHITIIMVTHDPKVAGHANRVIRMQDGVILDDAPPAGANPKTPEGAP
jgi:ABC-type lipoprotein export system ATPase subunit